ncbi:MAG TPA: hypothetical protein VFQ53_22090 [Kofleriaceae bacterium]|nr:hypothetical protein [Kofleriaceae bacterium]
MQNHHEDGEPTPCTCECHGNPRIKHITACCTMCPKCGQRFAAGLRAHEASCPGRKA